MDSIKVLIADDEKIVRDGLTRYIDWEEYNMRVVETVENGKLALEIVENQDIDLVIADIHMPVMDGMELIARLEKLEAPPLVVLISGFSDFSYAQEAVRSEIAQDYILKPLNFDQMDTVLSKVCQRIVRDHLHVAFPVLGEEEWKAFTRTCARKIRRAQKTITEKILAGSLDGAMTAFDEGIAECTDDCRSLNYLARFCIEVAMSTCEIALERMDSLELLGNDPVDAISRLSSEQEIFDYVRSLITKAVTAMNRMDEMNLSPLIHAVLKHVNDNYTDSSLSLSRIAEDHGVSPGYLSAKFKEEVMVNFSKYLNGLRIKKAKECLSDLSLKVYMVSERVGYDDVRYFSRIFRKSTGFTPTEYQKNISNSSLTD